MNSILSELKPEWPMEIPAFNPIDHADIKYVYVDNKGKTVEDIIKEIPDDTYILDGLTPDGYIQEIRDRLKNES